MHDAWDGWLNQSYLANSLIRDYVGNVLGLKTRVAWGKLDNGPITLVRSWIQFQQMSKVDRVKQSHSIYGAKAMTTNISAAFSHTSTRLQPM